MPMTIRQYLSGKGPDDAVSWNFKCTEGQNSNIWTTIEVPSCWEQQGFGSYDYGNDQPPHEKGFYKTTFDLQSLDGKHVNLVFQGVMTDALVKINGKQAGPVHQGGFTAFSYEITDLIKAGENTLEVEVSKRSANEHINKSQRKTDFWLFSGIFRPVYLEITPTEYIERVAIDADMNGYFRMQVHTKTVNGINTIEAQIETLDGILVSKPMKLKLTSDFIEFEQDVQNIKPWSHEYPNLYQARITLLGDGKPIHQYLERFGFRTFEHRAQQGFYLNGKRILLKGVNRHCFRPQTARTLSRQDSIEDIKLIRSMNMNSVRCSHYAPDKHFLELCDEMGLLVLHELLGWHHPVHESVGRDLVRELVTRDVNHPCVIMWSNGNHNGFNPELMDEFDKWDIQKRRVLHNEGRHYPQVPESGRSDLIPIDTRFYPTYKQLKKRTSDRYIVLPNECLHGLYDGGIGAGLEDYWNLISNSPVGGGLIFWAFADEGIARSDRDGWIDTAGNKAPDGIVGPNFEKEGSYYTIQEIWSPIQIEWPKSVEQFTGSVSVKNDFSFINLNECQFEWNFINFHRPQDPQTENEVLKTVVVNGPDVPAGLSGKLVLKLPGNWKKADALLLTGNDPAGREVWTWTMPIQSREALSKRAIEKTDGSVLLKSREPLAVQSGSTVFQFDSKTGLLSKVKRKDESLSMNGPTISAIPEVTASKKPVSINITERKDHITIESSGGEFRQLHWIVYPGGVLELKYTADIPAGKYDILGLEFDLLEDEILGKKWLGAGPYRVWKNRRKGTRIDVWQNKINDGIAGEKWTFPEFKGFFAEPYWAHIQTSKGTITLGFPEEGIDLGVGIPENGKDPRKATWKYPKKGSLFLFHVISGVGTKTKMAIETGPMAQPTKWNGKLTGTVWFQFE